jgi:DnaJ domain
MLVLVAIGRVDDDRGAFLEPPFDFVGPLSLDELETHGRIAFGACIIMSRQRWREDQADLRREAHENRRAQARRLPFLFQRVVGDDARYRDILNLPLDGALDPSEIKAAFRRLAKTTHPDGGGSNEQFHRITQARDALLERARDAAQ